MTLADLCRGSISDVAPLLESRSISPIELTAAMLDRIDRIDPELHSYVHVAADAALAAARAAQAQILSGEYRGPLHGIPLGIKDIFDTVNMPTLCGAPQLAGRLPERNAFVVDRLNDAGAVMLGKQATAEFAFIGYRPDIKPPVNPWNADRSPMSSSGGSAVAVAASLCFGSFGSDTGGSIRYPSAANGIVGLKPTFGRISRQGVYPFAETLDHVGPMARSVRDVAILYQSVAGCDPQDPFSAAAPVEDALAGITAGVRNVRLGFDVAYYEAYAQPDVLEATLRTLRDLEAAGAELVPVDVRGIADVCHYWLAVAGVEALSPHGRERFPGLAHLYGRNVRELLEGAMRVTPDQLVRAASARRRTDTLLDVAFGRADFLILPGMGSSAPPVSAVAAEPDVEPDAVASIIAFSAPFNFSGHPTLSIPNALDADGMPIGVQLVGRPFDEAGLLKVGHALEQSAPTLKYPKA